MRELREARYGRIFASPVLEHIWSDGAALNEQLRTSILEHARQHPVPEQTNVGGWHSEVGRLDFCGSAGERLIHHIHEMTEEATLRLYREFSMPPERLSWILSAWANVSQRGDFNNMHTHPGATWSGVYYVDNGKLDLNAEGTAIQLFDPNPARTNVFFPELTGGNIRFRPEPGLMIVFPGYMPHAVPPHRGDRPRISIAFNLRKDPFP